MKKIVLVFVIIVFWGGVCVAGDSLGGTSQSIGNFTFHNFDGVSGTSQQIGKMTFHNFSDGTSGTSQRIGGTTFHNFNSPAQRTWDYRLGIDSDTSSLFE